MQGVLIKKGTGNEETGNEEMKKWGNEEMNAQSAVYSPRLVDVYSLAGKPQARFKFNNTGPASMDEQLQKCSIQTATRGRSGQRETFLHGFLGMHPIPGIQRSQASYCNP